MNNDEKILEKAKALKADDLFLIDRHEEAIEIYKSITIPPHDKIYTLIREDIDALNSRNYKYGHEIVEEILFGLPGSAEVDKIKLMSTYLERCRIQDINRIRIHFSKEMIEQLVLRQVSNFIENSGYHNALELLDNLEEPSRAKAYKVWTEKLFLRKDSIQPYVMMQFLEKDWDHNLVLSYARYLYKMNTKDGHEDAYKCFVLLQKIMSKSLLDFKDEIIMLNLSLIIVQNKLKDAEEYTEGCMKMISINSGKENYPAKILIALGNLVIREGKLKCEEYEKALLFFKLSKDWEELRNVARYIMNQLPKDCESLADKYYFEAAKLSLTP